VTACPPVVEYRAEFQARAAAQSDLLHEGYAAYRDAQQLRRDADQAWACQDMRKR
jgi:hypothetical protein